MARFPHFGKVSKSVECGEEGAVQPSSSLRDELGNGIRYVGGSFRRLYEH
jgi:hypothetical protein